MITSELPAMRKNQDPRRMFADPSQDEVIDRGQLVVRPLLPTAVVEDLKRAYFQTVPPGEEGLAVAYMRRDRSVTRALSELLEPTYEQFIAPLFVDCQLALATFVVKYQGPDSVMFLHDDRTFVDERRWRSLSVWIPLVDTGPNLSNGALAIVPGSDRLAVGWSGSLTPEPFRQYEQYLSERLVPVEASAGTAVIYDSRTLHASESNHTTVPRIAMVIAVVPAEADLIHARGTARNECALYRVDRAFYLDHHIRDIELGMPEGYEVIETVEEHAVLDPATVQDAVGRTGELPQRQVIFPEDIRDEFGLSGAIFADDLKAFETALAIFDRAGIDWLSPTASADDLPPTPVLDSDGVTPFTNGGTAPRAQAVVRRGRALLGSLPAKWSGSGIRDVDLLELQPFERWVANAPITPRWVATLQVVDGAGLGAGMVSAASDDSTRFVALDQGCTVRLVQGEPATIFNDGPGPLRLVVVRHLPSTASLADRLVSWAVRLLPER